MKKRKFENFMFHEAHIVEEYLEKMAAKGWLLIQANNYFWTYEKIEPTKLNFSVTYFSEASGFNPYPSENQVIFYEYCEAAGWKLASEWNQMQIFYTDKTNPIPIETDEVLKLQTIQKSMRNKLLSFSLCILLLMIQLSISIKQIFNMPFMTLTSYTPLIMILIYTLFLLQLLNTLISYAIWYFKSKRCISEGGSCYETSQWSHRFNVGIVLAMWILLGLELITLSLGTNSWIAIDSLILFAVMMTILCGLRFIMKKLRASKTTNIIVSMFFGFILCFVTVSFLTEYLTDLHWQAREPADVYVKRHRDGTTFEFDLYHDNLPLMIENMKYVDSPYYSYEKIEEAETFLLYHLEATQRNYSNDSFPELDYEIVDVKFAPLYDLCLKKLMHLREWEEEDFDFLRQTWEKTDDEAWHADAVYELYVGGKPSELPEYVVCWGNRMVRIRFMHWDFYPDAYQIKIAADRLSV